MNKINFNFEEHKGRLEVVHCKTIQEAKQWCQFMHNNGLTWYDGTNYLKNNEWDYYKENTCYFFNERSVCDIRYVVTIGYTIIEFSSLINKKLVKL